MAKQFLYKYQYQPILMLLVIRLCMALGKCYIFDTDAEIQMI